MTWVYSSVETLANFGLDNCDSFRLYVDGGEVAEVLDPPPVRPVRHRFDVQLERGWHQVLVKLLGGEGRLDFHFHLMDNIPTMPGTRGHGRTDLINTYLPDEIARHFA
jgi:hypothetical protein